MKMDMRLKNCLVSKNQPQKDFSDEKENLIFFISRRSSRFGDRLIDFMEKYHLINLQQATVAQLRAYIADNHLDQIPENEPEKTR